MQDDFTDALLEADEDEAFDSIVVTGAGNRAFCAGQDLKEASSIDADASKQWIERWRRMYGVIRGLRKPTVACLNGVAAGSAFQVALLLDIRVGHSGSRMGQPEILSGLASITGPWIMKESLGISRTTELALTGRIMDGEEAHRIGLIHFLENEEDVFKKSLDIAASLAGLPREAFLQSKSWLRKINEEGMQAALDHAALAHAKTFDELATKGTLDQFTKESRA